MRRQRAREPQGLGTTEARGGVFVSLSGVIVRTEAPLASRGSTAETTEIRGATQHSFPISFSVTEPSPRISAIAAVGAYDMGALAHLRG